MKQLVGILCALAIVASVSAVHAEGYAGFRAGGIRAVFTGDDADQAPWSRIGFTGGGFIGFDSGNFGFRTDVLYTMKGGQSNFGTFKLDYLELAPLFVAKYEISDKMAVRGFVGPVFSVWINAEFQQYYDDGLPDSVGAEGEIDADIGEVVKHFELSGTIGIELNYKVGPYVALLESRYTQGSSVFDDFGPENQPLNFKVSNSGISVMAGLMVPF